MFLFDHDLFGKPVSTGRDHALSNPNFASLRSGPSAKRLIRKGMKTCHPGVIGSALLADRQPKQRPEHGFEQSALMRVEGF